MSNEVSQRKVRKMSTGGKIFAGLVIGVDIANACVILTSEYGGIIFIAEAALGIAVFGYIFYRAGLKGREIEEKNALAEAKRQYELEHQTGDLYFYKRE